MSQTDILAHFKAEEKTVPDVSKFDVVYDAATGSGAGEDYKNKENCQIAPHANLMLRSESEGSLPN